MKLGYNRPDTMPDTTNALTKTRPIQLSAPQTRFGGGIELSQKAADVFTHSPMPAKMAARFLNFIEQKPGLSEYAIASLFVLAPKFSVYDRFLNNVWPDHPDWLAPRPTRYEFEETFLEFSKVGSWLFVPAAIANGMSKKSQKKILEKFGSSLKEFGIKDHHHLNTLFHKGWQALEKQHPEKMRPVIEHIISSRAGGIIAGLGVGLAGAFGAAPLKNLVSNTVFNKQADWGAISGNKDVIRDAEKIKEQDSGYIKDIMACAAAAGAAVLTGLAIERHGPDSKMVQGIAKNAMRSMDFARHNKKFIIGQNQRLLSVATGLAAFIGTSRDKDELFENSIRAITTGGMFAFGSPAIRSRAVTKAIEKAPILEKEISHGLSSNLAKLKTVPELMESAALKPDAYPAFAKGLFEKLKAEFVPMIQSVAFGFANMLAIIPITRYKIQANDNKINEAEAAPLNTATQTATFAGGRSIIVPNFPEQGCVNPSSFQPSLSASFNEQRALNSPAISETLRYHPPNYWQNNQPAYNPFSSIN